ncbi:hypothetical protein AB0J72_17575 [Dactylosporangium sp. NPDC049742]|uniref:hypothetical protein n=1 Tax=Dactylosporangium sp. NPDC049742 TaxID=3154737 RepID=UPI0034439269
MPETPIHDALAPDGLALDSLTPDVAERLLDLCEPAAGRHAGVAALLVAAAGPALPAELTGEDDTVREFRRAYRRTWRRRRNALIACAVAAVVSLGGTAYAASGAPLPDPVRRTVESLFGDDSGSGPATPSSGSPAGSPAGTPGPSRSPSPEASGPGAARIEELCRAWEASRTNPQAPPVSGEDRRMLAQAAKSATGINDFCRGVLAPKPAPTTPAPTTPAASRPGEEGADVEPSAVEASRPGAVKPGTAKPSRTHPVKQSGR